MRGRARVLAVVAVVSLVAVGCGRSSGREASGAGDTSTTGAAQATTGDFGSLKGVCGPGDAKGATDQGVTDTEITVGTMADPGATIQPGLDQELFDAADAFVGWCNQAGGILGRKLKVNKHDAKLFETAARMTEACGTDFALVGNGEGLDDAGVGPRVDCKLPELSAFDVSAKAGVAPYSIQAMPTVDAAASLYGPYRAIAQLDPQAIKKYGMITTNIASIKDASDRNRAGAKLLGYDEVSYQEVPAVAVDNWRPFVENARGKGVEVLTNQLSPDNVIPMLKAMSDVGWFPRYIVLDANNYNEQIISGAAATLDKTTLLVNSGAVPFEAADKNPAKYPATKLYMDNVAKYANAKPKSLGVNSTSAWLLFAEAAKACGSQLTRQCVLDKAAATTDWTGGGLHAPRKPSDASGPGNPCFLVVKATASGFVLTPDITKPNTDIYNCDPQNTATLPGFPRST